MSARTLGGGGEEGREDVHRVEFFQLILVYTIKIILASTM